MASLLSRVTEGGRARRTAYSQINLINDTIPSKLLWNSFVTGFLVSDESDHNPIAASHYLMSFYDFDYAALYNSSVLSSTEAVDFYDIAFMVSQAEGVTTYYYPSPGRAYSATKVSDADASRNAGSYIMRASETLNVDEAAGTLTANSAASMDIQASHRLTNKGLNDEPASDTALDAYYPQNDAAYGSSSVYNQPINAETAFGSIVFGIGLFDSAFRQDMTEGWAAYHDSVLHDGGMLAALAGLPDTNVVCELVRNESIFEPMFYANTDGGNSNIDAVFGTDSKWCVDAVEIQYPGFSGHLHETPISTKGILSSVNIFVDAGDPGTLEPDDPDLPIPDEPDPGEDPDVVLISAAGISDIDFVVNPNSYYTIHVEVPDEISIVGVGGLDKTMSWNAYNQQLTGWVLGQTVKEVVFTLSNGDTATLRISAAATPAHVI